MSEAAAKQLDAIHSMLNAGQRNLRMETHSLLLWGAVGGLLCLFSDYILTPQQIPDNGERAVAWLALLAAIFGAAGYTDWQLTRASKQARDETWSFIHRQIMKFWWLLLALGALTTFAMFFFGGGYMLFPVWIALLGMGLVVHGLFSAPLLQWAGGLLILTAVCALGYRLEFETMKWLAGSAYGAGLPLLALFRARKWEARAPHQLLAVLWLACVIGLPLGAAKLWPQAQPAGSTLSLNDYRQHGATGAQILHLPAGTQVPIELSMAGDLFSDESLRFNLMLAQPLELATQDGELTGEARKLSDRWTREVPFISIPDLKVRLAPDGPQVQGHMEIHYRGTPRR